MRLLAILPNMAYVAHAGVVYLLPADGRPGQRIQYPDIEARALRNHAAFLRRQGREPCADEYDTAAAALEAVQGAPLTAA